MVLIKAEDSIVQAKEKPSKDAPLKNYQMKSDVPIENIPWLLSDSNPWVTVTLPDSVDPPPGINYDSLSSSYSAPSLCGRSVSTHSRSTGSEYIIDSPYDFQGGSITSPIPQRTKRQFSTLEPSSSKFSPHNNESDLLGLLQPEDKTFSFGDYCKQHSNVLDICSPFLSDRSPGPNPTQLWNPAQLWDNDYALMRLQTSEQPSATSSLPFPFRDALKTREAIKFENVKEITSPVLASILPSQVSLVSKTETSAPLKEMLCSDRNLETLEINVMNRIEVVDGRNSDKESEPAQDDANSEYSDDAFTAENSPLSLTLPESLETSELSPLKQAIVDRVMEEFHALFAGLSPIPENPNSIWDCQPQVRENKGGVDEPKFGATFSSSGSNENSQRSSKRRRLPDDEPPEDDEEKNDHKKRKMSQNSLTIKSGVSKRYACHFHQYDPSRYCSNDSTGHKYRTCGGPGWEDVHRIKEHLYRCHAAPIECGRCYTLFKTKNELSEHTRADTICERKSAKKIEGIDEDKMGQLRRRKKRNPEGNEDERWKEIYMILFPGEPVPSPFYDGQPQRISSPSSRRFVEFEEYSRQELPQMVRNGLEMLVSKEMQPMEESLKRKLFDLIRDSQQSVLDKFRAADSDTELARSNTASVLPLVWSADLSNQMVANDFPNQSTSSVLGPQEESRLSTENHGEWDLFHPPPMLDHYGLERELNSILPKDVPHVQPSDSGYGSILCTCKSSNQSTSKSDLLNPSQSNTQQSQGFNSENSVDEVINTDFDWWWNPDSSIPGHDQLDYSLPKCDRCGGDIIEVMEISSYSINE